MDYPTLPPLLFFEPHGEYGWLSNWSKHPVNDLPSAEHCLMYEKAFLFGDVEMAVQIRRAKTSAAAKRLGRNVHGFNEQKWRRWRFPIMTRILEQKVAQHPELNQKLLETGTRHIAEASPYDNIWGIGTTSNKMKDWIGLNLLGIAWMDVRLCLRLRNKLFIVCDCLPIELLRLIHAYLL
jgi:ribA/ribD-fused uncharacterized protein